MTQAHSLVVNGILHYINVKSPHNVVAFKRVVGSFIPTRAVVRILKKQSLSFERIKVGITGQSDIYGIITLNLLGMDFPVHFEIEVKVGKDRLKLAQKDWLKSCSHRKIPHCVASCPEDVVVFLDRIKTRYEEGIEKENSPIG